MADRLRDLVLEANARERLFPRGARVLVAVSGGADSAALLHVLASLRPDLGIDVCAAHLDHGLRSEESAADARWVGEFAERLGVPATIGRRDVAEAARRLRGTTEEIARRVRREFLEQTAREQRAERIALGHTRDDQAETVLLNILRGAGIDGLRGMAWVSGAIVRPLLGAARADTEAYCRAHGIAYREDASNRDLAYRRNRVRAELLPNLETYYNPSVRDALIRLSEIARADVAVLDELAERRVADAARLGPDGAWSIEASAVIAQPPGLRRRIVRRLIARASPGLVDVHLATIEALLAAVAGCAPPVSWTLPGARTVLLANRERLLVRPARAPETPLPVHASLSVPGTTDVPSLGIRVQAETLQMAGGAPGIEAHRAYVPTRALAGPLAVRNRRPGDRMRPMGLGGSRKIQDILTDRKVPAAERDRLPIFVDAAGVLWIPGVALDERAAISGEGECVVRLTVERLPAS